MGNSYKVKYKGDTFIVTRTDTSRYTQTEIKYESPFLGYFYAFSRDLRTSSDSEFESLYPPCIENLHDAIEAVRAKGLLNR